MWRCGAVAVRWDGGWQALALDFMEGSRGSISEISDAEKEINFIGCLGRVYWETTDARMYTTRLLFA